MIKRQCRVGWDEMHMAGSRRVSQEGLELVAYMFLKILS